MAKVDIERLCASEESIREAGVLCHLNLEELFGEVRQGKWSDLEVIYGIEKIPNPQNKPKYCTSEIIKAPFLITPDDVVYQDGRVLSLNGLATGSFVPLGQRADFMLRWLDRGHDYYPKAFVISVGWLDEGIKFGGILTKGGQPLSEAVLSGTNPDSLNLDKKKVAEEVLSSIGLIDFVIKGSNRFKKVFK